MRRRLKPMPIALVTAAVGLLVAENGYADNCSSLNDCYYTLRAALAAAVGLGVFSALTAIGLDIGPFSGARRRMKGGATMESVTPGEVDEWDRSLGLVRTEGLEATRSGEPPSALKARAGQTAARQGPAVEQESQGRGMLQAEKESGAVEARDLQRSRSAAEPTEVGRRADWSGGRAEQQASGADSGDVADRARDVAASFEERGGTSQDVAPERAPMQSEAKAAPPQDDLVSGGISQSEPPGAAAEQRGGTVSQAGPSAESAGESMAPEADAQESGRLAEGQVRPAGHALEADVGAIAEGDGRAAGHATAGKAAQPEQTLVTVAGSGSIEPAALVKQAAAVGEYAVNTAREHLSAARKSGAERREAPQVVRASEAAPGQAAADLVLSDGTVVEVKSYYWAGPYFQSDASVTALTRRLVRQLDLLRRRYDHRRVQLAFGSLAGMPPAMAAVLQSVGVGMIEAGDPPAITSVASQQFLERMRSIGVEAYGRALLKAGWPDTSPGMARQLRDAFRQDPQSAWLGLAVVAFDGESIYETSAQGESYAAHLHVLAPYSGGSLAPGAIHESIRDDRRLLSFENRGARYECDVAAESDYFDYRVLDIVNRAVADQGESRRFIPLPSPDQLLYLAFVEDEVMRRLRAEGLVPGKVMPLQPA